MCACGASGRQARKWQQANLTTWYVGQQQKNKSNIEANATNHKKLLVRLAKGSSGFGWCRVSWLTCAHVGHRLDLSDWWSA